MVLLALLLMAVGVFFILGLVLVGLFEAPWPILLGLLLLGLYALQRFSVENDLLANALPLVTPSQRSTDSTDTALQTESISDSDGLVYRGVHYCRSESVPTASSKIEASASQDSHSQTPDPKIQTQPVLLEGVYRGKRWQRLVQGSAPAASTTNFSELTYRGHKVKVTPGDLDSQTASTPNSSQASDQD